MFDLAFYRQITFCVFPENNVQFQKMASNHFKISRHMKTITVNNIEIKFFNIEELKASQDIIRPYIKPYKRYFGLIKV